jgi:hypothetical protein
MNACSNCAGFASPALMGRVLQTTNNWNTVLFAGIVSTFVAAYLWIRVIPPLAPPLGEARLSDCVP